MNDRTSRRSFVALASGALAGLAAGLGRVFAQGPSGGPHPHLDAATPDPLPDMLLTTTYTYDAQARLLSVTTRARAAATTFRYAHEDQPSMAWRK